MMENQYRDDFWNYKRETPRKVLNYYQDVYEECPCCGHKYVVRTQYLYDTTNPTTRLMRYMEYVKSTTGWNRISNFLFRFEPTNPDKYYKDTTT